MRAWYVAVCGGMHVWLCHMLLCKVAVNVEACIQSTAGLYSVEWAMCFVLHQQAGTGRHTTGAALRGTD